MNVVFTAQCYIRDGDSHDPLETIKVCTDDFTVVFILFKLHFTVHRRRVTTSLIPAPPTS